MIELDPDRFLVGVFTFCDVSKSVEDVELFEGDQVVHCPTY